MEPTPKLLAYRNVVPDPIFMSERGNRSHVYAGTWQSIHIFMPKRGNRSQLVCWNATPDPFNKPQSQSQVYLQDHTFKS